MYFHSIIGLKWDGIPRLDEWLIDYGGADDNPYVRRFGAILLIAIVRRVKQPGCKFDEIVILVSKEGIQQSTTIDILAIKRGWFLDTFSLDVDTKEAMGQIQGKLIIEG